MTAEDKILRHAHYVERYKTHEANKIDRYLRRVDREIRDLLSKQNTISGRKRLLEIQKQVRLKMREIFKEWSRQLELDLGKFGNAEGEFTAKAIDVDLGTVASDAQLIAAIKARPYASVLLRDEFLNFTATQTRLINNAISDGFYTGKTTAEIIRTIRGTKAAKFQDGILNISRRAASTLTRTSIQHTANVAKFLVYENNADLFTHYQWRSTLDGRTSSICQALSGNVYIVGKGPLPPAHRNCRSTTIPVLDDELINKNGELSKKLTRGVTQSSKDGQVSANLTYGQWLKQQPVEFQESVLGKARAKLFRNNKLPLDRYIENGKPIPLDELVKTQKLSLK